MAKGKKEDEASDAGEVPTRAPRKPLPTTSTGTNLLIADSLVRGAAKLLRKDIGDRIERIEPKVAKGLATDDVAPEGEQAVAKKSGRASQPFAGKRQLTDLAIP